MTRSGAVAQLLLVAGLLLTACLRAGVPAGNPRQSAAETAAPPVAGTLADQDRVAALLDRGDAPSRLAAGRLLRALGRPEEAVAQADGVILSGAGGAEAFVLRGQAFMDLGRWERALEDMDAALVQAPDYIPALLSKGDVLLLQEDPARAEAAFDQAARLARSGPEAAQALVNRGVARHQQGRLREAVADYGLALKAQPDFAAGLENRGAAWLEDGKFAAMCADYARACALGRCARLHEARAQGFCPGGR